MKICLYSTWSDSMADLVAITHPNHSAYSNKHGYIVRRENISYNDSNQFGMKRILELLAEFDAVLLHDADMLFMNHRIKIESLIQPGDAVVMARETHGWWPINNGITLFVSNAKSKAFCARILADFEVWKKYQWLWQTHTWNLIQDVPLIRDVIRLVHPKEMNCTAIQGQSAWQLGDFILHFLGLPIDQKIVLAKHYSAMAGEPTYFK